MLNVKKVIPGDVLVALPFTSSKHLTFTKDHFLRVNEECTFVRFEIIGGKKLISIVQFEDGRILAWRTNSLEFTTIGIPSMEELSGSTNVPEPSMITNEVVKDGTEFQVEHYFNPDIFDKIGLDKDYVAEIGCKLTTEDLSILNKAANTSEPVSNQLNLFEVQEDVNNVITISASDLLDLANNPEEIKNLIKAQLGITLEKPSLDIITNKGYFIDVTGKVEYYENNVIINQDSVALSTTPDAAIALAAFSKLVHLQSLYNKQYIGNLMNRYCITYCFNASGNHQFIIEECGSRFRSLWFYSKEDAIHFISNNGELLRKASMYI